MAVIKEVASFDIDTTAAQRSINQYIDSLQKLEKQREENIKLGKSTVQVNKQIDATIKQINTSLSQTAKTRQGQLAQLEATRKAQQQLSAETQKQLGLARREEEQTRRRNRALRESRRQFSDLRFLAVGAAAAIFSAFSDIAEAAIAVENALFPQIALNRQIAEASKGAAVEFVKEAAALETKLDAVTNANAGSADQKEAINAVVEEYGPYLSEIAREQLLLGNVTLAREEARQALLADIIAKQKAAIAEQLLGDIIEGRITQIQRNREAQEGLTGAANSFVQFVNTGLANAANFSIGRFDRLGESASSATDILNEFSDVGIESAISQLRILADSNDEALASLLATSPELSGIIDLFKDAGGAAADLGNENNKNANATKKAAEETKDLTGTIAGLQAQLTAAKKVLSEGIQVTDEDALREQQGLINSLEERIKDLQEFLKSVGDEPIELTELDLFTPNLNLLEGIPTDQVEEQLREGLRGLEISDLRVQLEQVELRGLVDLEAIERERQEALAAFRGTAEARDALNEEFNQRRLQRERQTAREVINLQLQILAIERETAEQAGENLTKLDTQIAQLRLELAELDAQEATVTIDADVEGLETKAERAKETLSTIVSGVEELGGQILGFLSRQAEGAISQLESDIARQQAILGELLNNQAGANAQQVQLERDRLDALVAQRKKAQEQQAAIATAEIALNLAVGVARAAAEGGGIGSAFTIAALILAAGIGFLQARQQAQQAFAGGTDYITRSSGQPSGTDTIAATIGGTEPIWVDEGEAIVQKDKNKLYHPAVKAIRRGSVDPKLLNDFVANPNAYQKMAAQSRLMGPSMSRQLRNSGVTFGMIGGGASKEQINMMINEQKKTRKAIEGLPITVTNLTERGIEKITTRRQNHEARNNKRFR